VAGMFYPASKSSLENEVKKYLEYKATPKKVIGLIAPHAGYIYSGPVAGAVYASAIVPQKCIVLSPNHSGHGSPAAIMTEGSWVLPTGEIPIESTLANRLLTNCSDLTNDPTAHVAEHSLEVQLPFLQMRQPKLSFVPITISHVRKESCKRIGEAIAKTIKEVKEDILIIASTDMNHYENQDITKKKDEAAIEKVLSLDPEGLLTICGEKRISMCGVVPTAIMLTAAKALGATAAKLVMHQTSGDTSGDYDAVVGYAGIIVY
jgi:AmmeMemoRadiSam system protein B